MLFRCSLIELDSQWWIRRRSVPILRLHHQTIEFYFSPKVISKGYSCWCDKFFRKKKNVRILNEAVSSRIIKSEGKMWPCSRTSSQFYQEFVDCFSRLGFYFLFYFIFSKKSTLIRWCQKVDKHMKKIPPSALPEVLPAHPQLSEVSLQPKSGSRFKNASIDI